jgi:hypothetical protein
MPLLTIAGSHSRFFNDVFSKGGFGGVWHTLRAFYDGDAYLALPLGVQLIDQAVSTKTGDATLAVC